MGNMSYCRHHNTAIDLQDCIDDLKDRGGLDGENEYGELLSNTEINSAIQLINLAKELSDMYADVDLDEAYDEWKTKQNQDA